MNLGRADIIHAFAPLSCWLDARGDGKDNDADVECKDQEVLSHTLVQQPDERCAMSTVATVEFEGVKVVAESALALCCRITGRDHWIPSHRLLEGSTVAHFGDRGAVIVSRQFAEDRGLLLHPFRPL